VYFSLTIRHHSGHIMTHCIIHTKYHHPLNIMRDVDRAALLLTPSVDHVRDNNTGISRNLLRVVKGGQRFESIVKGAFKCSSVIDWYWMMSISEVEGLPMSWQAMMFLKAVLPACPVHRLCLLLVVQSVNQYCMNEVSCYQRNPKSSRRWCRTDCPCTTEPYKLPP
jgi:hypothetical protein